MGNWQGEVVPSASRVASGNSGLLESFGAETLDLAVDVTAASGTTPTLDLTLEYSTDGGLTWFAPDPVEAFAQIIAATSVIQRFEPKAKYYRVVWAIAGTTPSFTFAVDAFLNGI